MPASSPWVTIWLVQHVHFRTKSLQYRVKLVKINISFILFQKWKKNLYLNSDINFNVCFSWCWTNKILFSPTGWGGVCSHHDPGGPQQHGCSDLPGLHRLHDPRDCRDRHCRTGHGLLQDSGLRQGEQTNTASNLNMRPDGMTHEKKCEIEHKYHKAQKFITHFCHHFYFITFYPLK